MHKFELLHLFMLFILILTLLNGCQKKNDIIIWHTSDLHYLSPSLVEDPEKFESVMMKNDGKVTHYSPEIVHSFVDSAVSQHPDAIIISGDLTLNGAKVSHRELAESLKTIKESGIRVFIIPGNHDISSCGYKFTSGDPEPVESVSPEEFYEIYEDFGYSDALSKDEESLSYVSELNEKTRLLFLDANAYAYCNINKETLQWTEKQLMEAQNLGCKVIAISHQNLMLHNPGFTFGYQISNAKEVMELYKKYNVELNLSGHLHLQHIASEESLTEIAVSSLSVSPIQYGKLQIRENGEMEYHTEQLIVSATDRNGEALDFSAYAEEVFDSCTIAKMASSINSLNLHAGDKNALYHSEILLNREYFAGRVPKIDENVIKLWEDIPKSFTSNYMQTILKEAGKENNYWTNKKD